MTNKFILRLSRSGTSFACTLYFTYNLPAMRAERIKGEVSFATREWGREFSPFSRSLLTFLAKQESKKHFGNVPCGSPQTKSRKARAWRVQRELSISSLWVTSPPILLQYFTLLQLCYSWKISLDYFFLVLYDT